MNSKYSNFKSFSNLIIFKTLKKPAITTKVINTTEIKLYITTNCYNKLVDYDSIFDVNYPQSYGDPHICDELSYKWREDTPV